MLNHGPYDTTKALQVQELIIFLFANKISICYNRDIITGSSDYYASARFPRYNNDNTKNTVPVLSSFTSISPVFSLKQTHIYSFGNNYNFAAAVASTLESPSETSICPKGWKLPTSDDLRVYTLGADYYVGDINTGDYLKYPTNFLRHTMLHSQTYSGNVNSIVALANPKSSRIQRASKGYFNSVRCVSSYVAPTTYSIIFTFDSGVSKITIKDGSFIAAGSTVTTNLEENDFVIARQKEVIKKGYSKKYKK